VSHLGVPKICTAVSLSNSRSVKQIETAFDRIRISVGNSEVGLASLTISAFCLRLICTNGMVSKTSVDTSYRHVSVRILKEFPEVWNRTSQDLDRQRQQWEISVQSPVENPESTLKVFNRQFELNKQEAETVEWAWPQETGDKIFHIVNTSTRAAHYPTRILTTTGGKPSRRFYKTGKWTPDIKITGRFKRPTGRFFWRKITKPIEWNTFSPGYFLVASGIPEETFIVINPIK